MARERNHTGTIVVVGGGALLLWLLLRSRGHALGRGAGTASTPPPAAGARCRVRVSGAGLEIDGAPADLATVVARCRAAGAADVTATGAARVGAIGDVINELRAAGVVVHADPAVLADAAQAARPEPT